MELGQYGQYALHIDSCEAFQGLHLSFPMAGLVLRPVQKC